MREIEGNIFEEQCDAICITTNGVTKLDYGGNLVAVMGAGIALAAKNRFSYLPGFLANHLMEKGHHTQIIAQSLPPKQSYAVVSFPTKYHWKSNSTIIQIKQSAIELFELANQQNWNNIILPRPGCSNGGLNWYNQVRPILREELDDRFAVITLERSE